MIRQRHWALALCLAVVIPATPALAQEQPAQARVKVKDLDLTRPADRMKATQRLGRSADAACEDGGPRTGVIATGNGACREELMQKGDMQLSRAAMERQAAKDAEMQRMAATRRHRATPRHHSVHHHTRQTIHHPTAKRQGKTTTVKTRK